MAKNNKSGSWSKHIDIKYLDITERVKDKTMVIEYINTELMITDPLTKGMPPFKFKDLVDHMGLGLLVWFHCMGQCNFSYDIFSCLVYVHLFILVEKCQ